MGTFTGKHLCYSLFFNENTGLQACHFIKKRLQYICFLDNTAKFLRTAIFKNICIGQFFLLYKFERFSPWKNNKSLYKKWKRSIIKNKIKNTILKLSQMKYLPFHDVPYHIVFLYFSTACQAAFTCIIKDDSREGL